MSKYLCMQRSLPGGESEKPSPAQMQEMYSKFGAWREKFKESLVDMGGRLGAGRLVTMEPAAGGPRVPGAHELAPPDPRPGGRPWTMT